MHPRIAEMLGYLDRERAALRELVAGVPSELRERRLVPDRWSVAEILEHLSIVERRITHLVKSGIDSARAKGLGQETEMSPVLWTVPVQLFLDRSRKLSASEAVTPKGALESAAAWQALDESRAGLRAVVAAGDGLALGDVVHPHPAGGQMNLYQWIGFIGVHEARHAAQIRELVQHGAGAG